MQATAAFLSLVAIFVTCVSAQSAQLVLQGRFGGNANEQTSTGSPPLLFSWPASSVYASFVGTGINATLSALAPTTSYDAYSRFVFYIDGAQTAIETTSPNATTLNWSAQNLSPGELQIFDKFNYSTFIAANLPSLVVHVSDQLVTLLLQCTISAFCCSGLHNITITKISEASYGQVTLESLTVAPGGK